MRGKKKRGQKVRPMQMTFQVMNNTGQAFQGPAELKRILKGKKDVFRRCVAEKLWIDRERQVGQFACLERRQSFDGGDEAILLSRGDHAVRQRAEFPDIVRPLERAGAERVCVSQRNFGADDRATPEFHDDTAAERFFLRIVAVIAAGPCGVFDRRYLAPQRDRLVMAAHAFEQALGAAFAVHVARAVEPPGEVVQRAAST